LPVSRIILDSDKSLSELELLAEMILCRGEGFCYGVRDDRRRGRGPKEALAWAWLRGIENKNALGGELAGFDSGDDIEQKC
jgi:hypothetical protein